MSPLRSGLAGTNLVQIVLGFLSAALTAIDEVEKAFDGIAFRVHVHVGVDIHRDLGVRVPGKRLHDLGVDALAREQREIRMA